MTTSIKQFLPFRLMRCVFIIFRNLFLNLLSRLNLFECHLSKRVRKTAGMGQLVLRISLAVSLGMSASIFLNCEDAAAEESATVTLGHVAQVLAQHSSRKTDKQFSLLIIHLTREELAELAGKWLKQTQTHVKEVAVLEAERPSAKGSVADQLTAEIETGMRRRNRMFRKLYLILKEWEAKGGKPEEIEKYKQYGKAVARSERKVGDPDAIRKMFTEWLTSPDGGVRIGFLLIGLLASIIAVIVFSWVFAGLLRHALSRTEKISVLLRNFLSRAAYWVILAFGIATVLSLYGVNITPILAAFGGASFIIGFATQSTLSNFASGLLLMINRPFDVGDQVTVAGVSGRVQVVSTISTIILTDDNETIIVPNTKVWDSVITNIDSGQIKSVN